MKPALIAAILAVLAAAGCGNDPSTANRPAKPATVAATPDRTMTAVPTPVPEKVWNESDLIRRLDLVREDEGHYWMHQASGCSVETILTARFSVEFYEGVGETVAKTPDGTAGVTIADEETATCLRKLNAALAGL